MTKNDAFAYSLTACQGVPNTYIMNKMNTKHVEVGRYFGIKGSILSEALKQVETRMKKDKPIQKEIEVLKGQFIIE